MRRRQGTKKAVCAAILSVFLIAAFGVMPASGALACPAMPAGATNYIAGATFSQVGAPVAVYENGGLVTQAIGSTPVAGCGTAVAKFAFSGIGNSEAYVVDFWTRLSTGNAGYISAVFQSSGSAAYELRLYGDKADLYRNASSVSTWKLPSTGKAMFDSTEHNILGTVKNVQIYVRPSATSGKLDVSFFIDGELMKNGASEFATIDTLGPAAMFGGSVGAVFRGIRVYKEDKGATAFESKADPFAEITTAENGLSGDQGGNGLPSGVTTTSVDMNATTTGGAPLADTNPAATDAMTSAGNNLVWIIGAAALLAAVIVVAAVLVARKKGGDRV